MRVREAHLVVLGLLILISICFSSLFWLPNGEESLIARKGEYRPNLELVARDQRILQERMEKANIPAPPLPKPDVAVVPDNVVVVPDNSKPLDDSTIEGKRLKVKEMMKFAWDGYRKYAWGSNELKPISKTGHSGSVFGRGELGATIVDAIDTLWIMGLTNEYEEAKKWVEMSLNIKENVKGDLSVFETNIRFVGGLLSMFALSGDRMFVKKAEEVARLLLPAFDTPTGIPFSLINLQLGKANNYGWASGGSSILSEFGSLQLEFDYLSNVTGDPIFSQKIERINKVLDELDKPDGLYPIYLNPHTGKWGSREYSMGAMADSFYEYLLKTWIIGGKKDAKLKRTYDEAIFAMEKKLLFESRKEKFKYFANLKGSRVEHKMEHLACFCAGMFALQAANEVNTTIRLHYMRLAEDIAHTCHESYARTSFGLGPEAFQFNSEDREAVGPRAKYYILRPEVVEGWFYLWRINKDEKYRRWAWDMVLALEKHTKVGAGYSGIRDVYASRAEHDDVQQSFFLAETLKYLYLFFDDSLPLDQWVFNTEAHPLPVRG